MTKELTPLEALEKIGKLETTVGLRVVPTKTIVKDFAEYNIIENALKEYEELKKQLVEWKARFSNDYIGKMVEARVGIEYKKLKALEIIKELLHLRVVQLLPNDSDTRLFVKCGVFNASIMIPPPYIDLLKEVLL